MDFAESKAAAAREIALAFGVLPMLLGLPGDNTFANYAEANRGFWRQTVLPLVARTAGSLAHGLGPAWTDAPLRLEPDLDRIDALSTEREALWARIGAADFLSRDEKRLAVGYGAEGVDGTPAGLALSAGTKDLDITVHPGSWENNPRLPSGNSDHDSFTKPNPGWAGGDLAGGSGELASGGGGIGPWVNQPRVPAGNPDGGQWTSEGGAIGGQDGRDNLAGGEQYDQLRPPPINLLEEDALGKGAHSVSKHVGRTNQELVDYLQPRVIWGIFRNAYQQAEGSFDDLTRANDMVNQALKKVPEKVQAVASGAVDRAVLDIRLGYRTGKEAYRNSEYDDPGIRPTYGVRIVLIHRSNLEKGFQVLTSFPINTTNKGWDWNSRGKAAEFNFETRLEFLSA